MFKIDGDMGSAWLLNKMITNNLWPSKLLYRAHYGSLEAFAKEAGVDCRVEGWNPALEALTLVVELKGKVETRHYLITIGQEGRFISRCFLNSSGDVLPAIATVTPVEKPKRSRARKAKVEA